MQQNPQRKLNSSMPRLNVGTLPAAPQRAASGGDIARAGAPKRTPTELATAAPGMRSRIGPSHEFLHGAPPVNDESEPPLKTYEQKIPLHPATTPKQRATIDHSNDPHAILQNAANLGRKA